ncbi:hypothetical protein JCM1393_23310 [Clostridium carnis]
MNFNKISNITFYIGIVVSVLGYYQIYKVKSMLPHDVCPIDNNRGMLIAGIILMVLSVITSYIYERKNKKNLN